MITTIFDTETTGLPQKGKPLDDQPRVCQIAAIQYDEKRPVAHLSAIIDNDMNIPQRATQVHGITRELAERVGGIQELAFDPFIRMVIRSDRVVAFNSGFDRLMMDNNLRRVNRATQAITLSKSEDVCMMATMIDVMKLPNKNGYSDYAWPNLQECYYHYYGKRFSGAHDAMVDVRALAAVYFAFLDKDSKEYPFKPGLQR